MEMPLVYPALTPECSIFVHLELGFDFIFFKWKDSVLQKFAVCGVQLYTREHSSCVDEEFRQRAMVMKLSLLAQNNSAVPNKGRQKTP